MDGCHLRSTTPENCSKAMIKGGQNIGNELARFSSFNVLLTFSCFEELGFL